jgi:hypothetical protein
VSELFFIFQKQNAENGFLRLLRAKMGWIMFAGGEGGV